MSAELGHIALILAFCVALLQAVIPMVGAACKKGEASEKRTARVVISAMDTKRKYFTRGYTAEKPAFISG